MRKLKRYLIDKKKEIKDLFVMPRELSFPISKNFVSVLMGPRRAGKSYYLFHIIKNIKKLKEEEYTYINFEDLDVRGVSADDIKKLIEIHEEVYGKTSEFIFFDEIQVLKDWEKLVYSLYEKKKHFIFLTGSSSKLLSKEIATSLRGRVFPHLILPFSFKEFLSYNKIKLNRLDLLSTSEISKIKRMLNRYEKMGGYADVFLDQKIMKDFYMNYLDLVIFKDLVERYGVENTSVLKFLIKSMMVAFSKELSINKIFNNLKSQGIKLSKKTLYNYASYLEDVFFVFYLKKFDYSIKKSEVSLPKVYLNDVGLLNAFSTFSKDFGRIYENIVFLKLKRDENKISDLKLYYYKTPQNHEVDFVIKQGIKVKQLIQVCYNVDDLDTKKREVRALIKASKELKCKNLLVITEDYENSEEHEWFGMKRKIKFIPLWKWLLEGENGKKEKKTKRKK